MLSILLWASCTQSRQVAENGTARNGGSSSWAAGNRSVPPSPVEDVNADGVIISHAISLHSMPKYAADFDHFDYVNPRAPKGGTLVLAGMGTFDSFHRWARRGDMAPASASLADALMVTSSDEIGMYYGLIAEKVEYPPEHDWIIFHLRPEARFQSGRPIRAEDVKFSFNIILEQGVEHAREFYAPVTGVEALDDYRVKFTLNRDDKDMLVSLGGIPVFDSEFWSTRDFSAPLTEVPAGSGAYTISNFSMGQYVTYERLKDYWAMDLPVIKGTLNFDYIRYDMYRDASVQLEALKAGDIDFRQENSAKQWATSYTGTNFSSGDIVTDEIPHEIPPGMQAFVFNISRPMFEDPRVREAINYGLDFEWANTNLFYGQYIRTRSYFQSTPFEALGLPSPEELKILEPVRDSIPPRVFSEEYQPPLMDGSGRIRQSISKAQQLLADAGYGIVDGLMTKTDTGEALEFELLIYSPTWERVAIPFQENLKKMGITMNIRMVDTTQYVNRLREADYDLIVDTLSRGYYPDSGLQLTWGSDYLESSYNSAQTQDETLDYFLDGIIANQNDNQALLYWGRAFDRVLQWRFYSIPQWHNSIFRVAYWNKFGKPEISPKYALGLKTWWYDSERAQELKTNQ